MVTTGKHLKFIGLDQNNLGASIQILAGALQFSTTISQINVSSCYINSSGLAALGRCLQHNSKLSSLDISSNPYSAESLTEFLSLQRNSGLKEATISHDLSKEQDTIVAEVNAVRSLVHQPKLVIKHAEKVEIPMESLKEFSKEAINSLEDKKAGQSLAIQQLSYLHANFRNFMNENNVLPLWILRSLARTSQPLSPGEPSRTIIEDVMKLKLVSTTILHKLDTEEQAISEDTELEEKEMRDILVKFCDVALDYIQNLHPDEIEEIEAKLNPQGVSEKCQIQ